VLKVFTSNRIRCFNFSYTRNNYSSSYAISVILGVENNATINPSSSSDFKIVAAHIKKSAKKKSIFFKNNK